MARRVLELLRITNLKQSIFVLKRLVSHWKIRKSCSNSPQPAAISIAAQGNGAWQPPNQYTYTSALLH
jgi:hypothetical protein